MDIFPAVVIRVLHDEEEVIINRGSDHGIKLGQKFLIYEVTEEQLKDLETGDWLGFMEIPKGTGRVHYIKEKWSIIRSDKTVIPTQRKIVRSASLYYPLQPPEEEQIIESPMEILPFYNPKLGDKAKPI